MTQDAQAREHVGRSVIGTIALVAAAVSAIGLVIMLGGNLIEAEGFTDDPNDNSLFADLTWLSFSLGGLIALATGVAAWIAGRRKGRAGDIRAGQIAVGYVVAAILVALLFEALTS